MITVGQEYRKTILVEESMLAVNVGSGNVSVFATPMMIALMEGAAAGCIADQLEEGQTSVGTQISTSHLSATAKGKTVYAIARVTAVEGKKVSFAISAYDDRGLIGEGTHERIVLNKERFEQKAGV